MKKLAYFAALGLAFASISCNGDEPKAEITLSVNSPTEAPASGGETTFTITTAGEWVITPQTGIDWYTINPVSGSGDAIVTITVEPNEGGERTSLITVTGGQTRTVTLTQTGATLDVSTPDQIAAAGGVITFDITTTAAWTIAQPTDTWITLDKLSGKGDDIISVTVEVNNNFEVRKTDITISADNNAELSKTITISQKASDKAALEEYLGSYEFSASTLAFDNSTREEIHGTRTWTDVLKKLSGNVNLIQFSNMADMQHDSFASFKVCYADFKWNGSGLSLAANRYAYPELFGYVHGGFIGCIHYESGPKKGKISMMTEFDVTLDKSTGELMFPTEFADPDDGTMWPASYVVFGWDNTGKEAGCVSPYLSNLTAVKIN
jgi:hypothetical protein